MEQGTISSIKFAINGLVYITIVILPAFVTYIKFPDYKIYLWFFLIMLIPFVICILFLWHQRKILLEKESILIIRPHAVVPVNNSIYILAKANNLLSRGSAVDFYYEKENVEYYLFSGCIDGITTKNYFQIIPYPNSESTHYENIKILIFENNKTIFKSILIKPSILQGSAYE